MAWTDTNSITNKYEGYTPDQYITKIRSKIRESEASFVTDADIIEILNDGRRELARDLLIFIKWATYNDVDEDFNGIAEFPADLISHAHIEEMRWNNSVIDYFNHWDANIDLTVAGEPSSCYLYNGSYLLFYPTSSSANPNIQIKYYSYPTDLTEAGSNEDHDEIPKYFETYIVDKTVGEIYRRRQDVEKAEYYESKAKQEISAVNNSKYNNKVDRPNIYVQGNGRSRSSITGYS